ncbi:MAG: hypothetical protein KIS96_11015 [Bauldia sp.]|nr:hypothetical protein [Bauldia sp.]
MSIADPPPVRLIHFDRPEARQDPAVADVVHRLDEIARHRQAGRDPDDLLRRQLDMVSSGELVMPAPFGAGTDEDRSTESIYSGHRIFYRFRTSEPYYWVTGTCGHEYALCCVYFPERRIAVTFNRAALDWYQLNRFDETYVRFPFEHGEGTSIVAGFPHSMHTIWNELPALERLSGTNLDVPIAYTHQPLGPLNLIFPELAGRLSPLPYADVTSWNRRHRFQVALGSRRIPRSTRERVVRVANELRSETVKMAQREFRLRFKRIVWLSVKPPMRTPVNQVEFLAEVIKGMGAPGVGFILNGVSFPWDLYQNSNYPTDKWLAAQTGAAAQLIESVLSLLPSHLRHRVQSVNGISLPDEFGWSELADFYVCHGGSMQNKVALGSQSPRRCPFQLALPCLQFDAA